MSTASRSPSPPRGMPSAAASVWCTSTSSWSMSLPPPKILSWVWRMASPTASRKPPAALRRSPPAMASRSTPKRRSTPCPFPKSRPSRSSRCCIAARRSSFSMSPPPCSPRRKPKSSSPCCAACGRMANPSSSSPTSSMRCSAFRIVSPCCTRAKTPAPSIPPKPTKPSSPR